MARRRKVLSWLAAVALLLALIGLVIVPVVVTRSLSPERVAGLASRTLDREVRIRDLGLHFVPMPRLRLEDVWVAPDIELGVLDVSLDPVALLDLRLAAGRVEVDGVHLALVRRADGSFGLGEASAEESAASGSAALPENLPELVLTSSRIDVLDHSRGEEPLRTRLLVERLALTRSLLGSDDQLSARLRFGASGERGTLQLKGVVRPQAEGGRLGGSAHLEIAAEQLDPAVLLPYLPESWDVRRVDGRVGAELGLVARSGEGLELDLELDLPEGPHEIGDLALGDGTHASMHVSWSEGGVEIREGRLRSDTGALGSQQGKGLDVAFGYADGSLAIESLQLDALSASLGGDDEAAWGVIVERSGSITLNAAPGKRGLVFGLSSAEARDVSVTLTGPGGANAHLTVETLSMQDVALGERANVSLEAQLGDGAQGRLSLRSETDPLTRRPDLAALRSSVAIRGEAVDVAALEPFLPDGLGLESRGARVDGAVQLERASQAGIVGDVDLQLTAGTLGVGPFELEAPARLRGRGGSESPERRLDLSLGIEDEGSLQVAGLTFAAPVSISGRLLESEGALAFRDGHAEAAEVERGDYRASSARAMIAFDDGTLSADPLTFEAYGGTWTKRGHLTLGAVPSFDVHVDARDVHLDDLAAVGSDRPPASEPILMNAEGHFSGRWTGEARWLDAMAGEGRLEFRDGYMPSTRMLRAIGRALVGRVPGVSRTAAEDLGPISRTPLERGHIPFRIDDGRLHTDAFEFVTGDYHVSAHGSLDHELQVQLGGDATLTARGLAKTLAFVSLPRAFRLPAIPIEASGPLDDLRFRADVSRVPMATLRGLGRLPGRATDAVRGAGGAVMDLPGRVLPFRRSPQEPEPVPEPDLSAPPEQTPD